MALELPNQFSHGRASLRYVCNLAAVQQMTAPGTKQPIAGARFGAAFSGIADVKRVLICRTQIYDYTTWARA